MGVVVRIGFRKALLRDGRWRCANPELERELNAQTRAWIEETGGPHLESRDPEAELAREITRRAGGVVVMHTPADPRRSRQRYFEMRQYRLDFSAGA